MATQSIKKNIVIHDRELRYRFRGSTGKAAAIATKPVSHNYSVMELKGAKNIKAFFGDKL